MFAVARKFVGELFPSNLPGEALTIPSQHLPEHYPLSALYAELISEDGAQEKQDELPRLIIIASCLQAHPERLVREIGDQEYTDKLSLRIAKSILPDAKLIAQDETADDKSSISRQKAVQIAQQKSYLGLQSLQILGNLNPDLDRQLDPKILLAIIALSSARDPWTTQSSLQIAKQLLATHSSTVESFNFINEIILQSFIRPLFSKTKPSAITSTGRQAMPTSAPPKKYNIQEQDRSSRPWKYDAVYSTTVFAWAIKNASHEIVSQSWHLFIPPLLTLLDDNTTTTRLCGLETLIDFLPKVTTKLLSQTGLGEVFEDAVLPTLLYLPSITPLSESVVLLPAAYTALFTLSSARFSSGLGDQKEQHKFLDRIMRRGIFMGYAHCNDQPSIVEILIREIRALVEEMGMYSVKHLKDILPMLSTVMIDSFSTARISLLMAALEALKAVILHTWPRISEDVYRMETLKGLCLCWKTVSGETKWQKELGKVRKEIKVVGRLFVISVEGKVDIREEVKPLIVADESLGDVFGISLIDGS